MPGFERCVGAVVVAAVGAVAVVVGAVVGAAGEALVGVACCHGALECRGSSCCSLRNDSTRTEPQNGMEKTLL